jgi:hypothetical protein
VHRAFVIVTVGIGVLVTVKVGKESTLVCEGVFQGAWAKGNFSRKVFEVAIVHCPSVALFLGPFWSEFSLPLRCKVPRERYRFAP